MKLDYLCALCLSFFSPASAEETEQRSFCDRTELREDDILFTLQTQASLHRAANRAQDEEALLGRILALQTTNPATPQRAILETQNALALALLAQGKDFEAEALYGEILLSRDKILPINHNLIDA